jgi:two-component system, chemotaxis family, chemotaxis protein CheY
VARSVLIVDDHAGFRSFARLFLESAGFDVVGEAGTGAAGIEAAARLRPDVVLLDVLLPDLDGFEVTRRIRAGRRPPAVILTSTRDASDFGRRIEASGARGFLAKAELSRTGLEGLLWGDGRSSRQG